jgi:hypothetical protein
LEFAEANPALGFGMSAHLEYLKSVNSLTLNTFGRA